MLGPLLMMLVLKLLVLSSTAKVVIDLGDVFQGVVTPPNKAFLKAPTMIHGGLPSEEVLLILKTGPSNWLSDREAFSVAKSVPPRISSFQW